VSYALYWIVFGAVILGVFTMPPHNLTWKKLKFLSVAVGFWLSTSGAILILENVFYAELFRWAAGSTIAGLVLMPAGVAFAIVWLRYFRSKPERVE